MIARVLVSFTIVAASKVLLPWIPSQAVAAAVTDEVSFTAVPAKSPKPSFESPSIPPRVGNISAAITLKRKITEIDDILKKSAKLISEITDLTGVAVSHGKKDAVVENIRIVKLADKLALAVIVTDAGVLKDGYVEMQENLDEDYFYKASRFISGCFKGYTLKEISRPGKIIRNIKKEYYRLSLITY